MVIPKALVASKSVDAAAAASNDTTSFFVWPDAKVTVSYCSISNTHVIVERKR